MKSTIRKSRTRLIAPLLLVLAGLFCFDAAFAAKPGWQEEEVDWRLPGGGRIKSIRYPEGKKPKQYDRSAQRRRPQRVERTIATDSGTEKATATSTVYANVIDSPPINGFVPYVSVAITDEQSWGLYDAVTEPTIVGNYLPGRTSDYVIGIFDTGASAHVINVYDAVSTGIYDADLVTSFPATLQGATSTIDAWVSQPLAVFTDGLQGIDQNTMVADDSNMAGQSNVAIIVGDIVESPNLPTIVGSPLALFYTTVIENNEPVILNIDSNDIVSPRIRVYEHDDIRIPDYSRKIVLDLRPTTAYAVQFMPCFEWIQPCPEGEGEPTTPSVVFGSLLDVPQSLFFADSTDLSHGSRTAPGKKLMFDTGAQITVISEALGAQLELFAEPADFQVQIVDVTGTVSIADGYHVDLLEISATPSYLSFSNVPVVVIDVASPEGGTLAGILGMNLFADIDFYIKGGGLYGEAAPYIKFEFLPPHVVGDIAPEVRDGAVDVLDLAAIAYAWLSNPYLENWNSRADMVGDAIINYYDFAVLAGNWGHTGGP